MNEAIKLQAPSLVCTCNDLYVEDIEEATIEGEDEYAEIMQFSDTFTRCGGYHVHVEAKIDVNNGLKIQ